MPPRWNGSGPSGACRSEAMPDRAQNAAMSKPGRSASSPSMPYPVMSWYTRRGLSSSSSSGPRPQPSSALRRTLVTNTSASAMRRRATACPSGTRRSTAIPFFDRLSSSKTGLSGIISPSIAWKVRAGSPPPGGSSLMTSAPQSARIAAHAGPATHMPNSTTFTPSNGPDIVPLLVADRRDRLRDSATASIRPGAVRTSRRRFAAMRS